jgi:LCP family protein required for cell wall assembly
MATKAVARGKKTFKKKKLLLFTIEIIFLLILAVVLFLVLKLSRIEKTTLDLNDVLINDGISEESQEIMADYKTIALFGLDNRSNGSLSKGNSDVIMIAAINNTTHQVKLASIYRDSYLDTGDGTYQKCNAAYAKGGPERAISMLNTNLDLGITDYVTVDFNAIIECIDLLGGVEFFITDDEASYMKGYIRELNELTGHDSTCPTEGGVYTFDGVQATAYARIRYGGGDDYKRTWRQRVVLTAMINKAQSSNLTTINKVINQMCDDIQTSFSNADLLALAATMFDYSLVDTTGFPAEKVTHNYGGSIGDVVIPCDLASNVTELHAFLYDDENYTPSAKVLENSSWIITNTGYKKGDGY